MTPRTAFTIREREALHRYQAAVAAASEFLHRAQEHFDNAVAAIELHIQRAIAAEPTAATRVGKPEIATVLPKGVSR